MQRIEKILEEIGELRGQAGSECTSEDHYIKKAWEHCLDRVVGIIRKHMNDDWIPVDDRLPEIRDYGSIKVWMTIAYPAGNATRQGFFENGRFINLNGSQIADKIIAWKPYQKPEPYQENRNS